MKRRVVTRGNREPARANGRIVCQRPDGHEVPQSFYWFPITPKKIRQAAPRIVEALDPERIILFGSFAHGKPTFDSDVDLFVVMESKVDPHERFRQVSALLYLRPFSEDIVVRTPAELEERPEVGNSFFREIVGKGIVLYERPSRRRVDQECGHLSRMHARALQRLKLEV
jgi:predicted nucleotidyltransferase